MVPAPTIVTLTLEVVILRMSFERLSEALFKQGELHFFPAFVAGSFSTLFFGLSSSRSCRQNEHRGSQMRHHAAWVAIR